MADEFNENTEATEKNTDALAENTKATQEAASAQRLLDEQLRRSTAPTREHEQNLGRLRDRAQETARAHESLNSVLKDQIDYVKRQAAEVGSLQSQFKDLGNSIGGFLGKMKQAVSISGVYNRLIREMQIGQGAFASSLHATTKSTGEASKASQKFVDAVHAAYSDARDIAGEYLVEVERVRELQGKLVGTFADQLGATDNMKKGLKDLTKEVFLFSRYMGVDATQGTEFLKSIMDGSLKTLKESRTEMMAVTRQVDLYSESVKKLGKRYQQTGQISKREFLDMLSGIKGEFKTGIVDTKAYSGAIRAALEETSKDLTKVERMEVVRGMGRMMANLSKAENFFGMSASMVFDKVTQNLGDLSEPLQERVKAVIRRTEGASDLTRWRALTGALRGSSEGMRLILEQVKEASGGSYDSLQAIVEQNSGLDAHLSTAATSIIKNNTLQEKMNQAAPTDKKRKEEQEKQLTFWQKSFEQLMKEGTKPEKAAFIAAKATHVWQNKVMKWMEKYPLMMAGVLAAAQLGGGLIKGLGGMALRRFAPGFAGRMGMMPLTPGGAPTVAPGAAPTVAKGGGFLSKTGGFLARGGGMLVRGLGAVGGAYMLYKSPELGKELGDTISDKLNIGISGGAAAKKFGKEQARVLERMYGKEGAAVIAQSGKLTVEQLLDFQRKNKKSDIEFTKEQQAKVAEREFRGQLAQEKDPVAKAISGAHDILVNLGWADMVHKTTGIMKAFDPFMDLQKTAAQKQIEAAEKQREAAEKQIAAQDKTINLGDKALKAFKMQGGIDVEKRLRESGMGSEQARDVLAMFAEGGLPSSPEEMLARWEKRGSVSTSVMGIPDTLSRKIQDQRTQAVKLEMSTETQEADVNGMAPTPLRTDAARNIIVPVNTGKSFIKINATELASITERAKMQASPKRG